jgi:tetratricopeptide (TPR) repeat protein
MRALIVVGVLLAVVAAVAVALRPSSESFDFPVPEVSPSPFRNTRPDVAYVGSAACRACHSEEDASFRHTGMGRSMAAVDPSAAPPDAVFDHPSSKSRYRVYRKDGRLWHRESLLNAGSTENGGPEEVVLNDVPLSHVVGSGRHAQTFLAEIDGFLVESPITWYADRAAWGMSPGYDRANHFGFERAVEDTCLSCHAGRAEAEDGSVHRMRIDEPALSCERCHGPGSLHIQRHLQASTANEDRAEPDDTIVNPSRLSRELGEAVCQQCHLLTLAVVPARGRRFSDYRPGLPLEDFRHDYRLESGKTPLKVVGHVEQMHLSRCYQQSGTMTCTTCHDPHHEPAAEKRQAHYQAVCLSCHQPAECRLAPARRAKENPENHCVHCHMPSSATEVAHVAFTQHRIGIHAQSPEAGERVAEVGELRPFIELTRLSEIDRQRSLGLAYVELVMRDSSDAPRKEDAQRSTELLTKVRDAGLRDRLVDLGLAQLSSKFRRDNLLGLADSALGLPEGSAAPSAGAALAGSAHAAALYLRAEGLAQQGSLPAAVMTLRELTGLRRRAADWQLLAYCLGAQGNDEAAIVAWETAARINPRLWKVHRHLADHYRQLGNADKAAWHTRRAAP